MKLEALLDELIGSAKGSIWNISGMSGYLRYLFGSCPDNDCDLLEQTEIFLAHAFLHYMNDNTCVSASILILPNWTAEKISLTRKFVRPDAPRYLVRRKKVEGCESLLQEKLSRRKRAFNYYGVFADLTRIGPALSSDGGALNWLQNQVPSGQDRGGLAMSRLDTAPAVSKELVAARRYWDLPALDRRIALI